MSFALLSGIKLHLEAAEPAGEGAFGAVRLLLIFLDTSSWSLVNLVSKGSLNSLWSVLHLPINVTFKHFQKGFLQYKHPIFQMEERGGKHSNFPHASYSFCCYLGKKTSVFLMFRYLPSNHSSYITPLI